jgi:hypothetical protein
MQNYDVIDRNNPLPAGQDFNLLRREGFEHLARLAGDKWTDFNTPDPGITLLEALCYAITEAAYRTGFHVRDLVAYKQPPENPWQCVFYTAKELLHNHAVTINDYRKLILDIEGVRNVWIEPSYSYEVPVYVDQDWLEPLGADHSDKGAASDPCAEPCNCAPKRGRLTILGNSPAPTLRPLELEGLYNVLIQYEDDINETPAEEEVRNEVLKRLHKHRNLCEDFINVISVRPQQFAVDISVVLTPDADPELVLAKIFIEIYRYFSPTVQFYTIDQMLQKPYPHDGGGRNYHIEDIFEGPALRSGFIEDAELERTDMFRDIHLSDLINKIADITGVRAITHFHVPREAHNYEYFTKWVTELREQRKVAQLDIGKSRAMLSKDSGIYHYDITTPAVGKQRVKKLYRDLLARERSYRLSGHQTNFSVPVGEYSDLDVYVPIQNDLPHIYGVNPLFGIPGSLDQTLRDAKVKQLRGYLLLFDQLLADHLAQLDNLNRLFSFCDQEHTRFFKVLHDESTYNLKELFIADEQLLAWKNQLLSLNTQQEEKNVEMEFLSDNIAELKARIAEMDEALKKHPDDKRLKRKRQTAATTLTVEVSDLSVLEKNQEHIGYIINDLNLKIESAETKADAVTTHFEEFLTKMLDAPRLFTRRRNRMLKHLVARLGEDTSEYDRHMRMGRPEFDVDMEQRLVADKMRLLQDYVHVSNGRNKGFNYWLDKADKKKNTADKTSRKAWGGDNISGVERRVSRLLGFAEASREYLTPSWIEVETLPDTTNTSPRLVVHFFTDDADRMLLFNSKETSGPECCVDDLILRMVELGSNSGNYQFDSEDRNNKTYHLFTLYDDGNPLGVSRYFNTLQDARDARDRISNQFDNLALAEGMHLIEHILLRPKTDEVLQYADKNPGDSINPPAEPVDLLCICLDECDRCGDCCFEIKPVDIPTNGEIAFPNPFALKSTLFIKDADNAGNLTAEKQLELKRAIQYLNNYSLSSDKKKVIIADSDGYPLADIALGVLPPPKPKEAAIISAIKNAIVNNQIVLSAPSPFSDDKRLEVKKFGDPNINASAYLLNDLLQGIYKLDAQNVNDTGNTITITTVTGDLAQIAITPAQTISGATVEEKNRQKKEIADKAREALLRCLSFDRFKIRITRLPKDKCYNDEAWVLNISALKKAMDPFCEHISFLRQVFEEKEGLQPIKMTFLKYEQLSAYLARIRIAANEEENYDIVSQGATFSVVLKDDKGKILAQTKYEFDSAESAMEWAENIRLGFAQEQERQCLCRDCNHNEDPYSFRATVVLPCWSRRFQNKAFRYFTEQTLRMETPAHINLQVVWLGMEAMRRFENLYRDWLIEMVETNGMPKLEVVNKLVRELCKLKNCTECEETCIESETSATLRPPVSSFEKP